MKKLSKYLLYFLNISESSIRKNNAFWAFTDIIFKDIRITVFSTIAIRQTFWYLWSIRENSFSNHHQIAAVISQYNSTTHNHARSLSSSLISICIEILLLRCHCFCLQVCLRLHFLHSFTFSLHCLNIYLSQF